MSRPSAGSSEAWRARPAHLLAQHPGLARGVFRLIVDDREFLMRGDSGLAHDRHVLGELGLPAQAAIGRVLDFLEFGEERARWLLGREFETNLRTSAAAALRRKLGRRQDALR